MPNYYELKKLYEELLDKCCADGLTFFNTGEAYDFTDWGNHIKKEENDWIFVEWGMTKFVLWEETLPYVLKIPFRGRMHIKNQDYCKVELENYLKAYETPIEDCFAWTDFLFNYHGYPVYIMEKVECNEEETEFKAFDAYCSNSLFYLCGDLSREDMYNNFDDSNDRERMIGLLSKEWGEEIAEDFLDFCNENNINDLHSGNFGYRDGQLVIIDYSGF